jgi:hypothetical protein
MLVGFLLEGWDYLIVRAYLAKLLNIPEEDLEADPVGEGASTGYEFVSNSLEIALRRFYHKCAQVAVVGLDNDGNRDLNGEGLPEDPLRRRHWLHPGETDNVHCRHCRLAEQIAAVRPQLHWLPRKPGNSWPIILVIPVEAIEAWLLITRAIVNPGEGSINAERRPRHALKRQFYGRPAATRRDVEEIAVPMIRSMTPDQIGVLRGEAGSFRVFSDQVEQYREGILRDSACW